MMASIRHLLIRKISLATACAAAILLTVAAGVINGHYSQRWGPQPELVAAAQQVANFPTHFGQWRVEDEFPLDEGTVRMLQCSGHVHRSYRNAASGALVSLAILVGPAGPIAVHTPEICYSSRHYTPERGRFKASFDGDAGERHTFWTVSFKSNDAFTDELVVYYAWSDGGPWTASRSPRFEFSGAPWLVKLQLAEQSAGGVDNACEAFLRDMTRSGWTLSKN